MDKMAKYSVSEKELTVDEIGLVTNCLLLIRNILHVPDNVRTANKKCRNQNQIMWNLFAQNLDKTILDLIAHQNSGVWCVSVVQLVALVYKVPTFCSEYFIWQFVVILPEEKLMKCVLSRTSMW